MMYINSLKSETKKLPIREIKDPSELYMPLKAYRGIMKVLIDSTQTIKKHQKIAQSEGLFSSVLHSPVSGRADGIKMINDEPYLKLINDFKNEEVKADSFKTHELEDDQVLEILKQYGIEGSGGAKFPTHLKLNFKNSEINTLIINAAECEPYLSADYALLSNKFEELTKAAAILKKAIKASTVVIAIEKQHKELIAGLKKNIKNSSSSIKIKLLENQYPQGGELQLIKAVTGQELTKGSIPAENGVIVLNVGTLWAVYRAFEEKKPYTERIITFSGEKALHKGNYLVKIGTPINFILKELKISSDQNDYTVVKGGPMMGKTVHDLNVSVDKGTGGILVLKNPKNKNYNCIQCGYCVDVCPQRLMPLEFARHYTAQNIEQLTSHNINDCIECGACAYICPSDVPLMKSIFESKKAVSIK